MKMATTKPKLNFQALPTGIHCNGKRLNLRGVNFFGAETGDHCCHGLWQRNYRDMIDQMKSEGINLIRLPLSVEFMEKLDDNKLMPKTINYHVNPELLGKSAGQVLDIIITYATQKGILILPDIHRNLSTDGISQLWYDDASGFPETRIISAWLTFLKKYAGNPYVFGVDLRNECHGKATWMSGNPATDWGTAAQRMGDIILSKYPHLLIFVEGIERRADSNPMRDKGGFWGSIIDEIRTKPIKLSVQHKLVYSPHVYGPSVWMMDYFKGDDFPKNMEAIWLNQWAYIATEGLGCCVIGELGGLATGLDEKWHEALTTFIEKTPALQGAIIVWSWNPNSHGTNGWVKDDWKTVEDKVKYYKRMSPNPTDMLKGIPPAPLPPPPPGPGPAKPPGSYRVTVKELTPTRFQLDILPK